MAMDVLFYGFPSNLPLTPCYFWGCSFSQNAPVFLATGLVSHLLNKNDY